MDIHNEYRAVHGSPPLRWNTNIASAAQTWADYLAYDNNCNMQHNTNDNYGENLGVGYSSWGRLIAAWYNEEALYNYNSPGFSYDTGHFTAVVWRDTTDVGCGSTTCDNGKGVMYVCQYSPRGNSGNYAANVCPPGTGPGGCA